jgi:hypothetical protein
LRSPFPWKRSGNPPRRRRDELAKAPGGLVATESESRGIDSLAIADVAGRAGMQETSTYRRWGVPDRPCSARRQHDQALLPDTGSAREDLSAVARDAAEMPSWPARAALAQMKPRPCAARSSGSACSALHRSSSNVGSLASAALASPRQSAAPELSPCPTMKTELIIRIHEGPPGAVLTRVEPDRCHRPPPNPHWLTHHQS